MAELQATLPRAAAGRFGPVMTVRAGTVLLLWALWEGAARSGLFYEGALPSSFKIARAALDLVVMPAFYYNFAVTLLEVAAALAVGVTSGQAGGLARWG